MCVSNGCVHCQSIRDSFAQYCSVAVSVCYPIQIGSANLRSVSPSMLSLQKIIYAPFHIDFSRAHLNADDDHQEWSVGGGE